MRGHGLRASMGCAALVVLVSGELLTGVAAVGASEPAWPLSGEASLLTAFGATYASTQGESVHRGIDLAADEGDDVLAPLAGTVTFVGSVPAVGGGTVLAASVTADDGLVITLLPLEAARVSRGATIAADTVVGTLAAHGDGSSEAVHLHVGARRSDVYLDPLTVLSPSAMGAGTQPAAPPAASVSEPVAPAVSHVGAKPAAPAAAPVSAAVATRAGTVPEGTGSGAPSLQFSPGVQTDPGKAATSVLAVPMLPAGVTDAATVGKALPLETARPNRGRLGTERPRPATASPAAASYTDLAETARRLLAQLSLIWRVALLATLVGLGALLPVCRRRELEEQPGTNTAPGGSDIAAAAGRC